MSILKIMMLLNVFTVVRFNVIKSGKRKSECGLRQRYQCKNCKRKFVNDPVK